MPAVSADTTPKLGSILAVPGKLLDHVPPVVPSDMIMVEPLHTVPEPDMVTGAVETLTPNVV